MSAERVEIDVANHVARVLMVRGERHIARAGDPRRIVRVATSAALDRSREHLRHGAIER